VTELTNELVRIGEEIEHTANIPGASVGWKPPCAPDDGKATKPKRGQTEDFNIIDNPGGWSEFVCRPMFKGKKKKKKKKG